ncbi:MAG: hypothetical protein QXS79_04560 [Candidatus Bathyarchaeia archaeon]
MGSNPIPGSNTPSFGALHIASPFKSSGTEFSVGFDIHGFEGRLEGYRRIIAGFGHNGEVALCFLDHLLSLRLSGAETRNYREFS